MQFMDLQEEIIPLNKRYHPKKFSYISAALIALTSVGLSLWVISWLIKLINISPLIDFVNNNDYMISFLAYISFIIVILTIIGNIWSLFRKPRPYWRIKGELIIGLINIGCLQDNIDYISRELQIGLLPKYYKNTKTIKFWFRIVNGKTTEDSIKKLEDTKAFKYCQSVEINPNLLSYGRQDGWNITLRYETDTNIFNKLSLGAKYATRK